MASFDSSFTGHENGMLMVQLPDSSVSRIDDVALDLIKEVCPLLYHAFEHSAQLPQASIEAPSLTLVSQFLCYLYTKSDYINPGDDAEVRSLLLHAQMYHMAQNFDVPELEVAAYLNFVNATELSCCSATAPVDLSAAIEFVYSKLANEKLIKETLLNYCVGCYKYHRLGEDATFLKVVFNNPEFHRGLCQTSLKRGFQDDPEASAEIMRLDVRYPNPPSKTVLDKRVLEAVYVDYLSDVEPFLSDGEAEVAPVYTKRRKTETDTGTGFILVHRQKDGVEPLDIDDSSSSEEGFLVVHRPKPTVLLNDDVLTTELLDEESRPNSRHDVEWPEMGPDANAPGDRAASPVDSDWSLL